MSPVRRVLSIPAFRSLFAARTVSQWGDTFNSVALVILVFQLTGSGLDVGFTVIFEVLPILIFGFVAGVIVDRLPRIQIMITADLARAAIAIALVLFHQHLLVVYFSAFGMSIFSTFFNPASTSLLPSLVDSGEILGANSALWSAAVLSQVVLAPLAGVLVATSGVGTAFAVNAGSFIISAILLSRLRTTTTPGRVPDRGVKEITAGWQLIRRNHLLSTLALTHLLAALSAGATSALLVVLAERHLHVGAALFGVMLGAIGAGAVIGPLLLLQKTREVRRPIWLFGPYLLRGLVDLALASFSNFALSVGALALYGVGTSVGSVVSNTTLQTTVPDEIRGRVFAAYDVIWSASRLASIFLGALLADAIGITAVYYLGALLLAVAGTIGMLRIRRDEIVSQNSGLH